MIVRSFSKAGNSASHVHFTASLALNAVNNTTSVAIKLKIYKVLPVFSLKPTTLLHIITNLAAPFTTFFHSLVVITNNTILTFNLGSR